MGIIISPITDVVDVEDFEPSISDEMLIEYVEQEPDRIVADHYDEVLDSFKTSPRYKNNIDWHAIFSAQEGLRRVRNNTEVFTFILSRPNQDPIVSYTDGVTIDAAEFFAHLTGIISHVFSGSGYSNPETVLYMISPDRQPFTDPNAAREVIRRLKHLARWRFVTAFANDNPADITEE